MRSSGIWFGVVIPLLCAVANIPAFPNPSNIVAFGICLGLSIVGFVLFVVYR